MKRVLIVSPHFPPVNAPDHQRVRMSLPYFRECGWEPTVLAVDADRVDGAKDALLAAALPPAVPVHRVGTLPARLTRLVGFGNIAYRAWFHLRAEGERLLRAGKFDLVYFSTTQFVATALGAKWQRKFGVPFVVDLQDPWRTDYYDRPGAPPPPGGWKFRFARWQANRLEEASWRGAAGFITVSETYLAQLRARYPWFAGKPSALIPFGASEADFSLARGHTGLRPAFERVPGAVHCVSVGAVGPIMRAAIERLCAGIRALRTSDPHGAGRLRFHFIGTSYVAGEGAESSVAPIAAAFGVSDLVREQVDRVGYFVAIKTLLAADAIVIPGSDDAGYNPSKIAPCFLAEKPVLALAPAGSSLERMVGELGFATMARSDAPEGDAAVAEFLRALLATPPRPLPATRATALFAATHTARARTRQQCDLFERALGPAS
ncbi:MAG TPA: glycosyltransferase [Opitutaceae bacterium]|nr:glycosyltransferase [Opitutaceae bacterium]